MNIYLKKNEIFGLNTQQDHCKFSITIFVKLYLTHTHIYLILVLMLVLVEFEVFLLFLLSELLLLEVDAVTNRGLGI